MSDRVKDWKVAWRDRGHGHGDYGVMDGDGNLVAEIRTGLKEDADLIASAPTLHAEIARLSAELDDIHEVHKKVMEENCPSDEVHCTCVPILRKEIILLEQLRKDAGMELFVLQERAELAILRAEKAETSLARLQAALDDKNKTIAAFIEKLAEKEKECIYLNERIVNYNRGVTLSNNEIVKLRGNVEQLEAANAELKTTYKSLWDSHIETGKKLAEAEGRLIEILQDIIMAGVTEQEINGMPQYVARPPADTLKAILKIAQDGLQAAKEERWIGLK
jgi:hypothetical protein